MQRRSKIGLILIACISLILTYYFVYNAVRKIESTTNKRSDQLFTSADLVKERLLKKQRKHHLGVQKFDLPSEYTSYHRGIRKRHSESMPQYQENQSYKELRRALNSSLYLRKKQLRTTAIQWKERGPFNTPGRTRAIYVSKLDETSQTWIAGAAGGGIWKTTDGGGTWEFKTPQLPTMAITSISGGVNGTETLYASTGEVIGGSVGIIGNGVFKSTDGGENWFQLPSTADKLEFSYINRIVADPENPDTVLLCTSQGIWEDSFRSEIYRSTDGGNSWDMVYDSQSWVSQLINDSNDFNNIYAAIWGKGVLKSDNGGVTWSEIYDDFYEVNSRIELAVAPSNTSVLYASVVGGASGSQADLYISKNSGENWNLVKQAYNNQPVDFLGGQGSYDNTIAVNPYDPNEVYFGGVNLWKTNVTDITVTDNVKLFNVNVSQGSGSIWGFINFGAPYFQGKLEVGQNISDDSLKSVAIIVGPGVSQKAHRFTVNKQGSGVPDSDYIYEDYVDVSLVAMDLKNNRQLMLSFRDQQEDGEFNLIYENSSDENAANQSREYVYVHDVAYDDSPNAEIAQNGGDNIGQTYQQLYFLWPVLNDGESWDPGNLEADTIFILYNLKEIQQKVGTLTNVSDAYSNFDEKNPAFDGNGENIVFHPDHHNMIMIPKDASTKEFQILEGSDGGLYLSNASTTPGLNDGDWTSVSGGYNTGQFYGADKHPNQDQFIGGMQDNGTWLSPNDMVADAGSQYSLKLTGDGFEAIWHYTDPNKIIGSSQYNSIYKSEDGGETWIIANEDITGDGPFITKLASSNSYPDRVFAVSSTGVFVSNDFGDNWNFTPISENWTFHTFLDVEVSKSNYDIVWAGSGMSSDQKVFVSTDGGSTFNPTVNFDQVELGNLSGIETHPFEDSTAYVLFSFAQGPKILRTEDLGQTWEDISGFGMSDQSSNGFPDVAVYSLLVRPDNPQILWAGTEIGIFESTDNGQSWSFLDSDLGATAVFQMKVVGDQVVVATHGRGIWTATLDQSNEVSVVPEIISAGTTITNELFLKVKFYSAFDSSYIYVDDNFIDKVGSVEPGEGIVNVTGLDFDKKYSVQIISYKNGKKYVSGEFEAFYYEIKDIVNSYENDFNDLSDDDFKGFGFSIIKEKDFANGAIHSTHPYEEGNGNFHDETQYEYYLQNPVVVDAGYPFMSFNEIVIVEPGETGSKYGETDFYDYVVVEGSKNGIDWKPVSDGYDSRINPTWKGAYENSSSGKPGVYEAAERDLSTYFNDGDTILIRFRLYSDPLSVGWGWAIDDLKIQVEPPPVTGLEDNNLDVATYPNPATEQFWFSFKSPENGSVIVKLLDLNGHIVRDIPNWNVKKGANKLEINSYGMKSGVYFVSVTSNFGTEILKKVIIR